MMPAELIIIQDLSNKSSEMEEELDDDVCKNELSSEFNEYFL